MKKYKIKAIEYSKNDWFPEYTQTSNINGVVTSNPKSPSGLHFQSKKEADNETLRILKEQGVPETEIEIR